MGVIYLKVNKVQNFNIEKTKVNQNTNSDKLLFTELMAQKKDEKTIERLNKLINDIQKQGKALAEKRTVNELMRYKKMVKEFLDEAVEYGLSLEKRGGFRFGGRTRLLKIIKTVDKKLVEITDEIINREKKGLDILKLVGEIEGLLIDIYT
jgi:hypothetical protein